MVTLSPARTIPHEIASDIGNEIAGCITCIVGSARRKALRSSVHYNLFSELAQPNEMEEEGRRLLTDLRKKAKLFGLDIAAITATINEGIDNDLAREPAAARKAIRADVARTCRQISIAAL
jgi:hypothetical protein